MKTRELNVHVISYLSAHHNYPDFRPPALIKQRRFDWSNGRVRLMGKLLPSMITPWTDFLNTCGLLYDPRDVAPTLLSMTSSGTYKNASAATTSKNNTPAPPRHH